MADSALHDRRLPNESADYRAARFALLDAEMALRRQTEAVAALRRALPPGGAVPEDYVFEEGDDARPVRLSALFGDKTMLLLYSYMYGPQAENPCPSCTSILDGLDRVCRNLGVGHFSAPASSHACAGRRLLFEITGVILSQTV